MQKLFLSTSATDLYLSTKKMLTNPLVYFIMISMTWTRTKYANNYRL